MTTTETQPSLPCGTQEVIIKEDGLYHGVPDSPYRRWAGPNGKLRLSKSLISYANPQDRRPSMARLKAAVDGKFARADTPALSFGRAFDTALLEPERFAEDFVTEGAPINKTTGKPYGEDSKAFQEWLYGTHPGKEYVSPFNAAKIKMMIASVKAHDVIHLIREKGGTQASMAWTDDHTGVFLRGRADKIVHFRGTEVVIDVKTAASVDDRYVRNAMTGYGYHIQAAMYQDGHLALTRKLPDFLLVFVEKELPHETRVVRVDHAYLALGRAQYQNVLRRWSEAVSQNVYPGAYPGINELEAPKWVEHELEMMGGIDD